MNILDILIKKNIISKDDIKELRQRMDDGEPIDKVLIEHGVKMEDILSARSEFLNIPIRNLGENPIQFEALDYIPEESAVYYKFVPLAIKDGVLEVGIVDPDNLEARDALNFISSKIPPNNCSKSVRYPISLVSSWENLVDMDEI